MTRMIPTRNIDVAALREACAKSVAGAIFSGGQVAELLDEIERLRALLRGAVECTTENPDEQNANARLIAAAPAQNAALVLAKHKIEQTLEGQYPDGAALRAALTAIDAAIAATLGDDPAAPREVPK